MASDTELQELTDRIADLFEGLDLIEVAGLLKIQLVMLVTQGAENAAGATEFLDEIRDEVVDMIDRFPFEGGTDAEPAKPN